MLLILLHPPNRVLINYITHADQRPQQQQMTSDQPITRAVPQQPHPTGSIMYVTLLLSLPVNCTIVAS